MSITIAHWLAGMIGVSIGSLMTILHLWWSEKDRPDATLLPAQIASLKASLDDAHREISRLTGEKHALACIIQKVKEDVGGC